jgi:hypothetical protein
LRQKAKYNYLSESPEKNKMQNVPSCLIADPLRGSGRSNSAWLDYYARTTKEQEERENAETRDFAASQQKRQGGS